MFRSRGSHVPHKSFNLGPVLSVTGLEEREDWLGPLWRTSNCKLRNAKVSRGWRAIRPSTVSKTCSNLSTSVCDKWRILSTLLPVTRYLEFVTVHHYAWRATMKNYRVERIHRANEKLSIHNFVNVKVFILKLWKKYDSVLFSFFFSVNKFYGDKLTLNYRRRTSRYLVFWYF